MDNEFLRGWRRQESRSFLEVPDSLWVRGRGPTAYSRGGTPLRVSDDFWRAALDGLCTLTSVIPLTRKELQPSEELDKAVYPLLLGLLEQIGSWRDFPRSHWLGGSFR